MLLLFLLSLSFIYLFLCFYIFLSPHPQKMKIFGYYCHCFFLLFFLDKCWTSTCLPLFLVKQIWYNLFEQYCLCKLKVLNLCFFRNYMTLLYLFLFFHFSFSSFFNLSPWVTVFDSPYLIHLIYLYIFNSNLFVIQFVQVWLNAGYMIAWVFGNKKVWFSFKKAHDFKLEKKLLENLYAYLVFVFVFFSFLCLLMFTGSVSSLFSGSFVSLNISTFM